MLFNSIQFAVFFVVVYTLYLVLNHKLQNRMLFVASCIFYGAWSWQFLLLMFVSITTDFFCAKYIHKSSDNKIRKRLLILNFVVNIGILGFFKYFNFFETNLQTLLRTFGFSVNTNLLHIILPIGISFYTFQAMSYSFDVYRKQLVPTDSFLDYGLFVTFFPQLVAGPIERASHLLPQVINPRVLSLDQFHEGSYLIFWGLFQKIFIADNLAKIANSCFLPADSYNGMAVILGLYAFAFQIYCDFAGYSNIARGLGKLMGFDIMVNFNLPYFATNPSEFWRRWHISLSTWLKDYLYIPLGGNRKGAIITYRNLAITMFLGGLWHGAAWTFVFWGIYHGILLVVHKAFTPLLQKIPVIKNYFLERVWFFLRVVFFFHLVCIGWLLFRAQSMGQAYKMLHGLILNFQILPGLGIRLMSANLIFFVGLLVAVEVFQFMNKDQMVVFKGNRYFKVAFYYLCFILVMLWGDFGVNQFIYFQF